jgi:energy-converting hydrogenase Eha subunit A
MNSKIVGKKLDQTANFIIFVQIVMTIFNVIYGFWAGSQYYLYGLLLSGMLIRAIIQAILMLWLINKEKNFPKSTTVWSVFVCCLASGFTNIFSSYTSFFWGNLELLLIVSGVLLLFRHYEYIRSIQNEANEKKEQKENKS